MWNIIEKTFNREQAQEILTKAKISHIPLQEVKHFRNRVFLTDIFENLYICILDRVPPTQRAVIPVTDVKEMIFRNSEWI